MVALSPVQSGAYKYRPDRVSSAIFNRTERLPTDPPHFLHTRPHHAKVRSTDRGPHHQMAEEDVPEMPKVSLPHRLQQFCSRIIINLTMVSFW